MEFTVHKENLIGALSDVSKAVSSRTPFPILTGIKMIADHKGLTLIGSNSDIVIERSIPTVLNGEKVLDLKKSGSVVVSSKHLTDIVKKLPGDIHIKADDTNAINLISNDIKIQLNGFGSEEYPNLPVIDDKNKIIMMDEELTEVIAQTVFAVAKTESNPILTGVNMSFSKTQLTCAATNSYRLAVKKWSIDSNVNRSIIVPASSLIELTKLMNNQSGQINIFLSENYIVFRTETFSLYSRLIAGNYPNVLRLVPKEFKTTLVVNTKQLLNGFDRACLFASEWKNNNIRFYIGEDNNITLSSNSSDIGNIEETINVKSCTGAAEMSLSLDGRYMMDALKSIKDGNVKISLGGAMSPILIEPANDSTQFHIISPVRSR